MGICRLFLKIDYSRTYIEGVKVSEHKVYISSLKNEGFNSEYAQVRSLYKIIYSLFLFVFFTFSNTV